MLQKGFQESKEAMESSIVSKLSYYTNNFTVETDTSNSFTMETDTSNSSTGVVITQGGHPLTYFS